MVVPSFDKTMIHRSCCISYTLNAYTVNLYSIDKKVHAHSTPFLCSNAIRKNKLMENQQLLLLLIEC